MELRSEATGHREDYESASIVTPILGVFAMLTAVLSPFAIGYGQLMFAPVLSLVTGAACYLMLEKQRSKSFFKKCVMASTLIAAITGGWSFAATKFRNDVYYSTAGQFAEEWAQYVSSGKRELAFEMTINEGYRQLESMNLVEYYNSDMKARQALEIFFQRPGVKALAKRGANAKWKYLSPRGIIKTQLGDVVKVAILDGNNPEGVRFIISLMRSTKETTDPKLACWYVMEVDIEV